MPNNYSLQVLDPANPQGPRVAAIIPHRLIMYWYKFFPVRYENFRAVKYVLENPKRIYSGVRVFNDGGWCFTGRPATWYVQEGVRVAFPNELVFAVYLNPRFYVYEARAETAAEDDRFSPVDWEDRYAALVWKNIS